MNTLPDKLSRTHWQEKHQREVTRLTEITGMTAEEVEADLSAPDPHAISKTGLNETELAMAMLQYGELRTTLDALEAQIKAAVLERGKTQTVGSVRASYSAGRKTYDYEATINAAESAGMLESGCLAPFEAYSVDYKAAVEGFKAAFLIDDGDLSPFGQVAVNWRDACKKFGLEGVVISQQEPSVTVKLL